MKIAAIAMALWLGGMGTAFAADAPEPCAAHVELRRVELSYKGRPGIWFDADVARCLLAEVRRAHMLTGLVDDLEARHGMQIDLQAMTDRMLALAIEEADQARAGQALAIKTRNEAERQLRKPGRSRGLWLAVGLVSGVVLVGVSAYALSTLN